MTICSTFCSEVEYNLKFPVSRPFVRHVRKRTELECNLPLISAVFFSGPIAIFKISAANCSRTHPMSS